MAKLSNNQSPMDVAKIAFDYDVKRELYKGAAQQTLAFSLLMIHQQFAELQASGVNGMRCYPNTPLEQNFPVPSWEAIRKGGEARSNFIRAVKLYLDVDNQSAAPQETRKQSMARADNNMLMKRRETLIKNTIDFAAALHAKAIPMSCFSKQRIDGNDVHVWRLPLGVFLRDENELVARPFNNDTQRALDGKSLPLESVKGDDVIPIKRVASIDAFKESVFPAVKQTHDPALTANPNVPATPAANNSDGAYNVTPTTVIKTGNKVADFNALVIEAEKTVSTWEDDESTATPRLSDFPVEVRNALAHLAAFYDASVQADSARKLADEETARANAVKAA